MVERRARGLIAGATLVAVLAGCTTAPSAPVPADDRRAVAPGSVLRSLRVDPLIEDRILALDPEHISDSDVRTALAKGPTPRIFQVHGGVYPVHLLMASFAEFLIGMGYPESRIRDAGDGAYSRSPYEDSARQAGEIAWYYEHEGMPPLLIGHSQGGVQVIKILHDLAGSFEPNVHVFDPLAGTIEERTTIVDPLTGAARPVVGLTVGYASVVGTGGWSLVLPMSWSVISRVRSIPDTVAEFTGYRIGLDLIAWDGPGLEGVKTFRASGKAVVRNVTLPAEYSHVFVPVTAGLVEDPAMRDWINAYDPDHPGTPPPHTGPNNALWAADVWHSIKKHWTLEAQTLIRARRAAVR